MKPAVILLGLALLVAAAFAAEESCLSRCGLFDPLKKCQCDSMCVYYSSCCGDYETLCPKKVARGDTFDEPLEIAATTGSTAESMAESTLPPLFATPSIAIATTSAPKTTPVTARFTDPNAEACSGRPFDAFLQLKNGSIYAFRGDYFFELDETSVLPGYPKVIQDVWGIQGPIDAAFTRMNCQGKTYIFKGNEYWRFEGDVLDPDYPRNISVGFDNIPNDIDAAFAIPAASHRDKEKAYIFKGERYYQYEFKHQPSHEECVSMTRSSPSVLFKSYMDLYCDHTWEDLFTEIFGESATFQRPRGPRIISRDWMGIRPRIDATMVGRVHLSPKPTEAPRKRGGGRRKLSRRRKQRGRGRQTRFVYDLFDDWLEDYTDYTEYSDNAYNEPMTEAPRKNTPVQNVYFFKNDKYYRVDLQTKRVASVSPPYPRSIAKYWLGCKSEASLAEKR